LREGAAIGLLVDTSVTGHVVRTIGVYFVVTFFV
jgi:hypothetical protein